MDQVYTQKQITEAWLKYKSDHCWKVLINGKKMIRFIDPVRTGEKPTSCKMVKIKDAVEFPKFLELFNG